MKGCILDRQSFDRGDIELAALLDQLDNWKSWDSTTHELASERIDDAEVVITNKVRIDRRAIEANPGIRLIMLAATGTDNVDLDACRDNNIVVCNARQYSNPAVVQHVYTLILSLMTRVMDYHRDVREGLWSQSDIFCLLDHPIRELEGKTLGIVGYGNLGQAVAGVGRAFGMEIVLCERPGSTPSSDSERLALSDFLAASDVVSLHCPLTEDTRGMFSSAEFAAMKNDAILINTARGAIVDTEALVSALRDGQIGGAGIDVLDQEPPAPDYPLLNPDIPNLIVTPHNAWGTRESRQRLVDQLAENLGAWRDGQPVRAVT